MANGQESQSPNQPDQERTTAYRDSSGPESCSDVNCATIFGDWEEPSGESRLKRRGAHFTIPNGMEMTSDYQSKYPSCGDEGAKHGYSELHNDVVFPGTAAVIASKLGKIWRISKLFQDKAIVSVTISGLLISNANFVEARDHQETTESRIHTTEQFDEMNVDGAYDFYRNTPHGITVAIPENSGLDICSDYQATTKCSGEIRRAFEGPEGRKYSKYHNGGDFGAKVGTPVIAATYGRIVEFREDDVCEGGRIEIETSAKFDISARFGMTEPFLWPLRIRYVHIDVAAGIRYGKKVIPGETIGYIATTKQDECTISAPHVHFVVHPNKVYEVKDAFNFHLFWRDGVGIVSCYDSNKPVPEDEVKIVAPIKCD